MIKNFIFDLGGVLIGFKPQNYLKHIGLSDEKVNLFTKLIWGSEEWLKGDKGILSYEQIIYEICKKNPKESKLLKYALENKNNDYILSETPANCKYVEMLKKKGFNIYYLSNVNQMDLTYAKEPFKLFQLADGAVYSCEVGFAKPEKYCYEILLNKYKLIPEESIFIDDNLSNVESAIQMGINSIHFHNLEDTKMQIDKYLLSKNT